MPYSKKFVLLPPSLTKINSTMAILRGPYGTGYVKRLGSTVGQKAGRGRYRISAYQPEVINPRSDAQLVQRAKFTFVTQLAGILTDAAIIGLERQPYTTLRTAFASINLPNVQVATNVQPNEVDVYLSLPKMQLAVGYDPAPSIREFACVQGVINAQLRVAVPAGVQAPDEIICVIACVKAFEYTDYNAQVIRLTPTLSPSDSGTRIYIADIVDFQVQAAQVDLTSEQPPISMFAYTLRYDGNKRGYASSEMGQRSVVGQATAELQQTMKLMYARHIYSRSSYFETQNLV